MGGVGREGSRRPLLLTSLHPDDTCSLLRGRRLSFRRADGPPCPSVPAQAGLPQTPPSQPRGHQSYPVQAHMLPLLSPHGHGADLAPPASSLSLCSKSLP